MRWVELSVAVDSESVDAVSSLLGRYGQGGAVVEERESDDASEKALIVRTYLPHGRSYQSIRQEILHDLSRLPFSICPVERVLKPEDWFDSVKRHFGVLEIGDNLIIKPGWASQPLPPSTRIVIELDPGAAFGTGLHPTTRLCLLRLEKYLHTGAAVFDLGTGTGILSIAAAKMGASSVVAMDIDPVAVRAARSNCLLNRVEDKVRVNYGTLSQGAQRKYRESFDIALANITARSIIAVSDRMIKVLKPRGIFVASGISSQGLDEVLIGLALAGFKLEAIDQEGEWYAVTAMKNGASPLHGEDR